MNNRQRSSAILNYKTYDRLPIVHFGFWHETLVKWANEGHITIEHAKNWSDSTPIDKEIGDKLGFDFNWFNCYFTDTGLRPAFERKIIRQLPDGGRHVINTDGVIILEKDDTVSIPAEIDHLLKDAASWQQHYAPRLKFDPARINSTWVNTGIQFLPFEKGGLEHLIQNNRENPVGLYCGSLFGVIRNWIGLEGCSYLYLDDEKLFDEIINTVGELCFNCTKMILETGAVFDFAHFWEDICCKNGPLIIPDVFHDKVGPHYKRITSLLNRYGIQIVSLDCDGLIDSLLPTWLESGVNTMFPIEVGTWRASIEPWRKKYGQLLRGVGGMDKTVFAQDFAAINAEIERLKPLVELGGYIPCPDHRIAPDAKWENVQYYCEKMRKTFS
jgi:hypothetical protein